MNVALVPIRRGWRWRGRIGLVGVVVLVVVVILVVWLPPCGKLSGRVGSVGVGGGGTVSSCNRMVACGKSSAQLVQLSGEPMDIVRCR